MTCQALWADNYSCKQEIYLKTLGMVGAIHLKVHALLILHVLYFEEQLPYPGENMYF